MTITPNVVNIKRVLDHIKASPSTYDQSTWHCGTVHCFAGHAQILSGKLENVVTVTSDARQFLGLSSSVAEWAFSPHRTLDDLEKLIHINSANFDLFDRDGFDCDLFDRDGFDCDLFDRDGFDRNGFDRDGFDRNGLNIRNETR